MSSEPAADEPRAASSLAGPAETAVMLIDGARGTVTGWTEGAERLLGYRAGEVVNRVAARFVVRMHAGSPPGGELRGGTSVPGEPGGADPGTEAHDVLRRLAGRSAWSGTVDVRHRDGRALRVKARATALEPTGGAGGGRWLVGLVAAVSGSGQAPGPGPAPSAGADRGGADTESDPGRREPPAQPAGAGEARTPRTGTERAVGDWGRVLLENSPVALGLWDTDLRCVWMNRVIGHARSPWRHRHAGTGPREALRGFDTDAVEAVMRQVLADGRPVIDHEFRWSPDDVPEERITSSTLFRLEGAAGEPLGVCSFAVDITASRYRAQLALVSEARRRIGTTLDVVTTAQELADVSVPLLADYASVDLAESVPLGGEPLGRLPRRSSHIPVFRRAAVASRRQGAPESAFRIGEPVYVPPDSPMIEVLETGEPYQGPLIDAPPASWLGKDPRRAASVRQFAIHSVLVVPLVARRTILGVAAFLRSTNQSAFTPDDVMVAQELGVRAGLSLDNARRYTRERNAALALQGDMLPRNLSGGSTVDVVSRYVPAGGTAAVGGDWFDVIPLPRGRTGLLVGDVVGHGIDAAAAMGRLRTAAFTLALLDLAPRDLLSRFDQAAVTLSEETRSPEGFPSPVVGGTCVYADYDPAEGACVMGSAGNIPPALITPNGEVTFLDLPPNTPFGVGEGGYETVEVGTPPGTVLAFYTNGLIGGYRDMDRGLERLRHTLERFDDDLDAYCAHVIDAMTGPAPADDVALLVVRLKGGGPGSVPGTRDAFAVPPPTRSSGAG